MGYGYDFNVTPVQVENGTDYSARKDAASARKQELQIRQMQIDQAKKAKGEQDARDVAAKGAYQPSSYTPPQTQLNVGGANLGYQPATVQGPAQFNRVSYLQSLQQSDPLGAMDAQQHFQQQDQAQQQAQVQLQDAITKAATNKLELAGKQLDLTARMLGGVKSAPPDLQAQVYQGVRQQAVQMGLVQPNDPQVPEQFPGMEWLDQKLQSTLPIADQIKNELQRREMQTKTVQTAEGVQQFNPGTGKFDQNIGKLPKTVAPGINLQIAGGGAGGFSDAALDQAAELYATSGQMPSLGMGKASSALRVKIANRAAELHPLNNLAGNKASYGADQASLKVVQKSLDSVTAFENTASKNLDQFLTTAAKVPDTGVPWLNQPIRSVNASGLGSADQAAFNAARQVALTEISKVVNNPNLTGTLSDSARKEVMELNPESATFAQIKKVAQVLKTDMANRRTALTSQRDEIKGRIGKSGPTLTNQNGGGISVTDPQGGVHIFPNQAAADNFKRLAGIN